MENISLESKLHDQKLAISIQNIMILIDYLNNKKMLSKSPNERFLSCFTQNSSFRLSTRILERGKSPVVHSTMKMIPGAMSPQDLYNSALNLFPLIHMISPSFSIASCLSFNNECCGTKLSN